MAAALAPVIAPILTPTPAVQVCYTVPPGPQGPVGPAGPPGATGAAGMNATGVTTDLNALSVASGGAITFSALQATNFCLKLKGTAPATSLILQMPNTPFVKVVDGSQANMSAATSVLFGVPGVSFAQIFPVQVGASYIVEYDGVIVRIQQIGAPIPGVYATAGTSNTTGVSITVDATYHTLCTTTLNVGTSHDKVKVQVTSDFQTSTTTYIYYQLQIDGSPVSTDIVAGGVTVFGETAGVYNRTYYTTSLTPGSHTFSLLVQNFGSGTVLTAGHISLPGAAGPDTITVEVSST